MSNVRHLMSDRDESTGVEKVAGSLVTEAALTVISAVAGGPIAPLLPILSKSIAATRQKQRIETELSTVNAILRSHENRIASLSDEQYKVINEAVLALLQTTQAEKLRLLRNSVANALTLDIGPARDATILSRVIRDISAEEARFLLASFHYEGLQPGGHPVGTVYEGKILPVLPNTEASINMSGLLSLGLLTPAESTWMELAYFASHQLQPQ